MNFKEKHKMLWSKLLQNTICCVKLRFTTYHHYGPGRENISNIQTKGGQVWSRR